MHLMKIGGPSDHSDVVSTHKVSNKKVYTERVTVLHIFLAIGNKE